MSLTGGLIIKSGRPTLPQFGGRPISTVTATPPVQFLWNVALPTTGDVRGLYFTYVQSNGVAGAEDIIYLIDADGVRYAGQNVAAVSGTVYYIYLDEDADVLLDNVNRTGMKADFPWYAQSLQCVVFHNSVVPAGSSLTGSVRYEQL